MTGSTIAAIIASVYFSLIALAGGAYLFLACIVSRIFVG